MPASDYADPEGDGAFYGPKIDFAYDATRSAAHGSGHAPA